MGKKKSDGSKKSGAACKMCGGCKNFSAGKGDSGRCKKKDKKRSTDSPACGSYNPR